MTDITREDARLELVESYGQHHPVLGELVELHNGATSFLAMYDQATGSDNDLPDDLRGDPSYQLKTARTYLKRAVRNIEYAATDRLREANDGQ